MTNTSEDIEVVQDLYVTNSGMFTNGKVTQNKYYQRLTIQSWAIPSRSTAALIKIELEEVESLTKQRFVLYFDKIASLFKNPALPSRHRFMLRGLLDVRKDNWVPRNNSNSRPLSWSKPSTPSGKKQLPSNKTKTGIVRGGPYQVDEAMFKEGNRSDSPTPEDKAKK
ncbi:hypothetical protein CONCODRAFT_3938 [Conidiobolus coronatus NRRL 28638]|uniref:Uncharacterized protein n=1 Tax=Conidiobolus coronatus (strain ATCC 28846 / CBS 209.66 / NRRL 28638) TaxID=796925 RepID=A0A137PE36_CONC2|nr:hypothetical protein CONCODRAFT_3938 [Conidiobolus coronatus NRRL 28638]|eukprot:KXN73257.1 hypothetical protein CONCODRAFT_3938 [Conidiobolus coronatus NRRL 28638]